MTGEGRWVPITCAERDALYRDHAHGWSVGASLTDLGGQYGDPSVFTEWWDALTEEPCLRDWRFPSLSSGAPDMKPCEHHVFRNPVG